MVWRKVAGRLQAQRLQPRLFRSSRVADHRDELGTGHQLVIAPTACPAEEDDPHDESHSFFRGNRYLEVKRPALLAHRLGAAGRKVTHGRITCSPPMEIGAQEPRLGQRSQVHAHGKRLTRERAARRFHAQPAGTVFCAIESPPDDRRGRNEQD